MKYWRKEGDLHKCVPDMNCLEGATELLDQIR